MDGGQENQQANDLNHIELNDEKLNISGTTSQASFMATRTSHSSSLTRAHAFNLCPPRRSDSGVRVNNPARTERV